MSQTTYGPLAGMTIPSAPPHQLDDMNDAARQATRRETHARALQKLQTAVEIAVSSGATWEEIRDAVENGILNSVPERDGRGGRLAAIARAKVHNGDDSF